LPRDRECGSDNEPTKGKVPFGERGDAKMEKGKTEIRSDEIQQIIEKANYEELVQKAEEWGQKLNQQGLRMAQIRRVFGEVKRLSMRWDPIRLRMLKPKLAYIAARAGRGGQTLRQILAPGIDAVFATKDEASQRQRFKVFADLFEAILAYFTAAERRGGER
jgi:CRISPR type III-A-associated protein Csm2